MTQEVLVGGKQCVQVASSMDLLEMLEAVVERCLDLGDAFAVINHGSDFCQLDVDVDGHLQLQTSLGERAEHAGFDEPVPDFAFMRGSRVPAEWHARARMSALAMTKAFVDGAEMRFPTELIVEMHAMFEVFGSSSPDEVGLLSPPEALHEADLIGVEPVPILLMGMLDPAGPTVVAVTALHNHETAMSKLVVSRLSPFAQDRVIIARTEDTDRSLVHFLDVIAWTSDAPYLEEAPSLVVVGAAARNSAPLGRATLRFLRELVVSYCPRNLPGLVASYRAHLGRPWRRIEDPWSTPSGPADAPLANPYDAWLEIMMNPAHAEPELSAIVAAWSASIDHLGAGRPHLSLTAAGHELRCLGFPVFPAA